MYYHPTAPKMDNEQYKPIYPECPTIEMSDPVSFKESVCDSCGTSLSDKRAICFSCQESSIKHLTLSIPSPKISEPLFLGCVLWTHGKNFWLDSMVLFGNCGDSIKRLSLKGINCVIGYLPSPNKTLQNNIIHDYERYGENSTRICMYLDNLYHSDVYKEHFKKTFVLQTVPCESTIYQLSEVYDSFMRGLTIYQVGIDFYQSLFPANDTNEKPKLKSMRNNPWACLLLGCAIKWSVIKNSDSLSDLVDINNIDIVQVYMWGKQTFVAGDFIGYYVLKLIEKMTDLPENMTFFDFLVSLFEGPRNSLNQQSFSNSCCSKQDEKQNVSSSQSDGSFDSDIPSAKRKRYCDDFVIYPGQETMDMKHKEE